MKIGENIKSILILILSWIKIISSTNKLSPMEQCEMAHPTARYFRGHCFIVGEERAMWNETKDKCKTIGNGHLASASSPMLADFIARNILTPHSYKDSWVGLKQSDAPLSQWLWHYTTHNHLREPSSILINNFTVTSNDTCVTIGKSSPRLKTEDCSMEKTFVCQYAVGGQGFREVKKFANKKPPSSSAAISFLAHVDQKCSAVCGMSPTLAFAYNQDTLHCEIYLELANELELSDAQGYKMFQKDGPESKVLGCIATEAQLVFDKAAPQLEGNADFARIDSHDMTCVPGFYLTEQNPSDNKWYTTNSPPKIICKDDVTWEMGDTGGKTFKCLDIPVTHPIYEVYQGHVDNHFFTAGAGGLLKFYAISSSAYCPEKLALHMLFTQKDGHHGHVYVANYNVAMNLNENPAFTYCCVVAYIVYSKGACGATKPMYQFVQPATLKYYYKDNTESLGPGWQIEGGLAWYAWYV